MTSLKRYRISVLSTNAERQSAAHLFGACIKNHWPVEGPETAYEWVREEFHYPETILLGIKKAGGLIACMAATPLWLMWDQLSGPERLALAALRGKKDVIFHVGGIAVAHDHRQHGLPEKMFKRIVPLLKKAGGTIAVAQTARPANEEYPSPRGLAMCLRLGFREMLPVLPFGKTVGNLEKVWLWMRISS